MGVAGTPKETGAQRPPLTSILITWALEPEYVQKIQQAVPDLRIMQETDQQRVRDLVPEADVIFAEEMPRDMLQAAAHVQWLHAVSAGVESWLHPELQERGILLTNSSGTHGTQIAELILGMALCFATGLHTLITAGRTPTHGHDGAGTPWPGNDVRSEVGQHKFDLEGQTFGVIGLGAIGDATARKAHGLGMRVLAMRRHTGSRPSYVERVLGSDRDSLMTLLQECDHVALCLPLTPHTERLIGEQELRAMKSSAYIYNVGRGGSIDQEALERALADGWIAGAGLDVTTPDPPEDDSSLWQMPNVILSQHTSGSSPKNNRLIADLFVENLRRYRLGEPLINLVDPALGY